MSKYDRTVEELKKNPNVRDTENVLLAAYLRYKGKKQVYVQKIRKGKGIFYFEMPEDEWNNLVHEYDESPELKFEHARVDTINLTYT